jgi:hypothetical protein
MTDKTIDAAILLPCPFCGGPGHEAMTCGKAIPDCESCAAVFGCNRCDVWCDTAEAWNTRTTDLARLLEAMRRERLRAESISLLRYPSAARRCWLCCVGSMARGNLRHNRGGRCSVESDYRRCGGQMSEN